MWATVADVEVRYGRPVTNTAQVQAWIGDVESTISRRIPDLEQAVASGAVPEATVRSVVANAVVRRLYNPEGLVSTTTSVDDGSVTKARDASSAGASGWLTDDEWALLTPQRASWSVPVSFEPGWSVPWC